MMNPSSITEIDQTLLLSNSIYHFMGQISFNEGLPFNHFYTRIKEGDKYYKMDGKQCNERLQTGNANKTMLLLYRKHDANNTTYRKDLETYSEAYIYDKKSLQYFWENKDEIKMKRADKKKEKYNQETGARKKKKECQKEYEKQKYHIPEEREKKKESQKEYEKQKYDIPEEREKKK